MGTLTTTATVPTNTSLTVIVNEDTTGDGIADNVETVSVTGSESYDLSNIAGEAGNEIWIQIHESGSPADGTPTLTDAVISFAGSVAVVQNGVINTMNFVVETQ